MRTCTHRTETGQCTQQVFDSDELTLVRDLLKAPGVDLCFYHVRLFLERTERPTDFMSQEELDATMGGRPHGDGRRLDQYVLEPRTVTPRK